MSSTVTVKRGVGVLGRLSRRPRPEPHQAVSYPAHLEQSPAVQRARAAVQAGKGPRHRVFKGSRWA